MDKFQQFSGWLLLISFAFVGVTFNLEVYEKIWAIKALVFTLLGANIFLIIALLINHNSENYDQSSESVSDPSDPKQQSASSRFSANDPQTSLSYGDFFALYLFVCLFKLFYEYFIGQSILVYCTFIFVQLYLAYYILSIIADPECFYFGILICQLVFLWGYYKCRSSEKQKNIQRKDLAKLMYSSDHRKNNFVDIN